MARVRPVTNYKEVPMPTERGFMTLDELHSHEARDANQRLQQASIMRLELERKLQPLINAMSDTVKSILEEYCGAVFPYASTKTEIKYECYGDEWKYVWRVWISNLTTMVVRLSDGPALEVFCPSRFCWQLDTLCTVLQQQTGILTRVSEDEPPSQERNVAA